MDYGQNLIIGISGSELTKEEQEFIVSENIGGVILFKKNLVDIQQTFQLCLELQKLSFRQKDQAPLFIAIDAEGGDVHRLSHFKSATHWPHPSSLQNKNSQEIFRLSSGLASELAFLGFNVNFAPCVDILSATSPLLKKRVFGNTYEQVIEKASPFLRGQIKQGLFPCLKHFPGHGFTDLDSHLELPIDKRSLDDLFKTDLKVYSTLLKTQVYFVMTAHIVFPQISEEPVLFSPAFLKEILRDQLKYKGMIVSDDLDMKALDAYKEKGPQALKAGCDVLLMCQNPESPRKILESLKHSQVDNQESIQRILKYKQKLKNCADLNRALSLIGSKEHKLLI